MDLLVIPVGHPDDARARSAGALVHPEALEAALVAGRAAGRDAVTFAGRQLLTDDALLDRVTRARALGFREVRVRTGAAEGSTPARLAALAAAGLDVVELPFVTHEAAVHDAHAHREGAFAAELAAMRALPAHGLRLWLRLLVGPLAARDPAGLVRFVAHELPDVERVSVGLLPASDARGLVPLAPLTAALTALLGAAAELPLSLRVTLDAGIPLCLFHEAPGLLAHFHRGAPEDVALREKRPPRHTACVGCVLDREWCPGLHPTYARVLGRAAVERVLRPFAEVPPAIAPPSDGPLLGRGTLRRVGTHGRIREAAPFARYLASGWAAEAWNEPVAEPLYVTREDFEALPVRGDGGPLVKLLRGPCFERAIGDVHYLSMPPLALPLLAGVLRSRGFDVSLRDLAADVRRTPLCTPEECAAIADHARIEAVVDGGSDPLVEAVIARIAASFAPAPGEIIGISVQTPDDVPFVGLLARALKRLADVPVVLGGQIMQEGTGLLARHPEVDFLVRGEGEVPLLLLVAALRGGWHLARVPSLIWRHGGGVRHNPLALPDFDLVPTPDPLDLDLGLYDEGTVHGVRQPFPYYFVKGCPFRCAFCGSHSYGAVRARAPHLVAEQVATLVRTHGLRRFYFLNTLLNVSRTYLEEFLTAMERERLDIEWTDCCRPGGIDLAVFPRLRAVGCVNLTWGVDAPNAHTQKAVQKGLDLEETVRILTAAHAAGIQNTVNVIIGLPHETDADREETRQYLRRIRPLVTRLELHPFRYIRTSRLYLCPDEFGLVRRDDEGFDEVGGARWEDIRKRLATFYDELATEFRDGGEAP